MIPELITQVWDCRNGRGSGWEGVAQMKLSPHFTAAEFCASDTAHRMGIDNDLPLELVDEAKNTAAMLESIRAHLSSVKGYPVEIIVTSGYRCEELNQRIGSSPGSDHIRMAAIDFRAPGFGSPLEVCRALVPVFASLRIGQLIAEFGSWIHVSTRSPDKAINRIITINKSGVHAGIQG